MRGDDETRVFDSEASQRQDFVSAFSLLSYWEDFGDVTQNAIRITDFGGPITLGARYELHVEDGTVAYSVRYRIFDAENCRRLLVEQYDEYGTDSGPVVVWEDSLKWSTDGWEPGGYTADVTVHDHHRDVVSEPVRVEFELR